MSLREFLHSLAVKFTPRTGGETSLLPSLGSPWKTEEATIESHPRGRHYYSTPVGNTGIQELRPIPALSGNGTDPMDGVGFEYTRHSLLSNKSSLMLLAEYYPKLTEELGISDSPKGTFYPLIPEANRRLNSAYEKGFLDYPVQLFPVKGEIDKIEFARLISKGYIPIATDGPEHFHDMTFHLPGYLAMPKEVLTIYKEQFTALFKVRDALLKGTEVRSRGPTTEEICTIIDTAVSIMVERLDNSSGNIVTSLPYLENIPAMLGMHLLVNPLRDTLLSYKYMAKINGDDWPHFIAKNFSPDLLSKEISNDISNALAERVGTTIAWQQENISPTK